MSTRHLPFILLLASAYSLHATSAPPSPVSTGGSSFGWFDGILVILMVIGVLQGRTRGMSGELLDLIQWLVILVGCGLTYEPLGHLFSQISGFGLLWAYIITYLSMALLIKIIFTLFKKSIGEKLVGSGVFGSLEYYLGMGSGMIRFVCMAVLFLAILNAWKTSDAEVQAKIKAQEKLYGKQYYPPLGEIQRDIFVHSLSGSIIKQNFPMFLIATTEPSANRETYATRRQRQIDAVVGK